MDCTLSTATRRGDRATNQDQVVVLDGAVAVLDGATSWLPQDPAQDGGWYARTLGSALAARLPARGHDLADVLADAIAQVRDAFGLDPERSPYSTASLVRWDATTLDVLVLGDSPVVVALADGGVAVVEDRRLEPVGAQVRARYRRHLAEGNGFGAGLDALVAQVQEVERTLRNRDGGFWVAGAVPEAAAQAVRRSWPVADVAAVAVMSDGVSAAVTDYGTLDWPGLVHRVRTEGAAAVVDAVHAAELTDPDGRRWPRTKRHDDKALVALVVS